MTALRARLRFRIASMSSAKTGHSIGGITRLTRSYSPVRTASSAACRTAPMISSFMLQSSISGGRKTRRHRPADPYAIIEYKSVKRDRADARSGRAGERQLGAGDRALEQHRAAKAHQLGGPAA